MVFSEINEKISTQYLTKNRITVTILDVIDPATYVLKEAPDLLNASPEAKNFLEAEDAMQKYYASVEPCSFLHLKDSIIVVLHKKKFYRARVIRILTQSAGHLFKVYLVDYGIECSLTRDCIYEIEKDFLVHPFQAVNFKLLGMDPVSMIMNPADLTMSYGPVSDWDPSAGIYVHDLLKGKCNASIEVQGFEGENVYGKLYLTYENSPTKCVNDELISNSFAYFNEDCWEKIQKLGSSPMETTKKSGSSYTKSISESSNHGQMRSPEQMSSLPIHSKPEPGGFGEFKVMFLRPSDNAVVARSSLSTDTTEESSLIQDFESKTQLLSGENNDTVSESSRYVSSQKASQENKSPESEAQLILEKRLQKLQQLNKKRHKSQMHSPNNTDASCTTIHSSSVSDTPKNKECYKDSVCESNILNECHDNKSSNGIQKLISEESPSVSPNSSLRPEDGIMTQDQLIAQKRLLRLQQRNKRHSKPSASENMNGFSHVEGSATVPVGSINNSSFVNGNSAIRKENTIEADFCNHRNEIASSIISAEDNDKHHCGGSESKILGAVAIPTQKDNLRDKTESEEILENVKTLQKLRHKLRLRKSLEASPTKTEDDVKHSCKSLSDDSFSTSSQSKSSASSPSSLKSNTNEISTSQVTELVSSFFDQTNVDKDKCESFCPQSRSLRKSKSLYSEKDGIDIQSRKCCISQDVASAFETKSLDTSSPILNTSSKADTIENNSTKDREIMKNSVENVTDCSKTVKKLSQSDISENASSNSDFDDFRVLNQLMNVPDPYDLLGKSSVEKVSYKIDEEESFIKSSQQQQSPEIKNVYFNEKSVQEKQNMTVLPVGDEIPSPVLDIDKANFSENLKQVLKASKFVEPFPIQSVVWPSMDNNRSVIAISPPRSGKTISYILPLVSCLTRRIYSKTKDGGPLAIILCSSWRKAQSIVDYFDLFLQGMKFRFFTLCTDSSNYKILNTVVSMINGCDILIATPFCLLQFLRKNLIGLSSLKNFIIDDGTTIINKNKKELKDILLCLMNSTKRKSSFSQMVLSAERWNKNFQIIQKKLMLNPLLYFTSFLDFAMYAELPIFVHIYESSEKKSALLDILQEPRKVVVCNSNAEDAVKLHHFLRCEDVRSFLVTEKMEKSIANGVIKDWKSARCMTSSHCLIITDSALGKMHINNTDCLIHYDMPQEFPLQFENRFTCFDKHLQKMEGISDSACHIFMSESDYLYASQVIDIMKNSGKIPPKNLIKLSKKHYQSELPSDPLCHYIKAFGYCQSHLCKHRHYIDAKEDQPQVVPCEGDIQALVTHIFDATHFIVKLLKYLDPVTNKTVSFIAAHAAIGFQLRDFYKNAAELTVKSPVVGESYVLEENKAFYRVKVLKCLSNSPNELSKFEFFYFDEGWIKEQSLPKLYKLTNQINLHGPLAVEVYACNISALDSSCDWNPVTTDLVKKSISGREIYGKIVLCLGETLWLDPIVLRKKLSDSNEYVNVFRLSHKLFDYGHARRNEDHLALLKQLCEEKISLPRLTKPVVQEVPLPQPELSINYAFLDFDVLEDVYVTSIVSPHQFYVQKAKFVDCLDELFDKINIQAEKRSLKRADYLYKGMHCIAPFHEDNKYYRAVISDVSSSTEVKLFYVDFGDSGSVARNKVYCIPSEFLLLPFQAIECELAGITAAHGGWTDAVATALSNLTRNEDGEMKILYLKVYSKIKGYEGGNRYIVDLWYNEKKLSDELVQAGYGDSSDVSSSVLCDERNNTSFESFDLDDNNFTSTDEGMHSEDRDTTALFYGVLANMVAEESNLKSNCNVTSSEEEKVLASLKTAHLSSSFVLSENIRKKFPKLHHFIGKTASTTQPVQSLKPVITWWDTPEKLHILIHLKDVKDNQLIVNDEEFNFNTVLCGKQYSAEEKFYDKVQSCDIKKFHNVEGINFTVPKCTPFKWPRLTKEKKKAPYIKYDLVHLDDSDTEKQPKNDKKLKLPPPNYYSEDSSSTDYDEKYVEPWRDFVQNNSSFDYFS